MDKYLEIYAITIILFAMSIMAWALYTQASEKS